MCARGSGSDFSENGFFAKTATSDLIQKESAGSGPCQNNSEISRAILQGWRPAPKPSLTLEFPTGSGASPQPSTLQPHRPVQRGPETRAWHSEPDSLSLLPPSPQEPHTHTHRSVQKAAGAARPCWSWAELPEQDLPGQGCLRPSKPPPTPPPESRFCPEFQEQ